MSAVQPDVAAIEIGIGIGVEIAIGIDIERQVLHDETVITDEEYDFDPDFDSDLDKDAKEHRPCVADMGRQAVPAQTSGTAPASLASQPPG